MDKKTVLVLGSGGREHCLCWSFYNDKQIKYRPSDFKYDTTGFYLGYCGKCGKLESYNKYEIWSDSRCCSAQLLPTKDLCSNQ